MLGDEENWRFRAESREDAAAAMEGLGDDMNRLETLDMADMLNGKH
jgi:hypothetical protein